MYTKFIIICRTRVGSTYLSQLLNSHSQVKSLGEQFIGGWLEQFPERKTDSVASLNTQVFKQYPENIKAVGFKLIYEHARWHNDVLWNYLRDMKHLKVIHLVRNVLDSHVSYKVAANFRSFAPSFCKVVVNKIVVSRKELLEDFEDTENKVKQNDQFFSDTNVLKISYEKLMSSDKILIDLQDYLGLYHEKLTSRTVKIVDKPLSEVISNYAELKESFVGTQYEKVFK